MNAWRGVASKIRATLSSKALQNTVSETIQTKAIMKISYFTSDIRL